MRVGPQRLIAATVLVWEVIVLSGCADLPHDTPIAAATRRCLADNKHFTDAWGCVQARYAADQEVDQRSKAFLKAGDDIASQVAVKSLKEADARKQLAWLLPTEETGMAGALNYIARP